MVLTISNYKYIYKIVAWTILTSDVNLLLAFRGQDEVYAGRFQTPFDPIVLLVADVYISPSYIKFEMVI